MTVRALLFSIGLATLGTAALFAQPASTPAPAQPQPRVTVPAPDAAQAQQRVTAPEPAAAQPQQRTPAPAAAQPRQRAQEPAPAATPTPQQRTPPPAPAAASQQQPRDLVRPEGQPLNIKVDVTITDQRGGTAAAKKTVSVVTADGMIGFIRSQALYGNVGEVPLNVDTEPRLLADGNKLRLRVNLQYELPAQTSAQSGDVAREVGSLRKTSIHESLSLILESGKSIVAAQSADPLGDRQVTIEVKATVLR